MTAACSVSCRHRNSVTPFLRSSLTAIVKLNDDETIIVFTVFRCGIVPFSRPSSFNSSVSIAWLPHIFRSSAPCGKCLFVVVHVYDHHQLDADADIQLSKVDISRTAGFSHLWAHLVEQSAVCCAWKQRVTEHVHADRKLKTYLSCKYHASRPAASRWVDSNIGAVYKCSDRLT